ncbi:GvpL/GvpF family gas vesicle protein [Halobacillus campisalis]|uniref:GvpL/GvpF family gas vesicle protein n=1 Tax=Halobacillus campisalis TaxID=435909 RepID=A0ABW2K1D4_9BACI|nr:GvpL/GvpF family gas vesicle protein [Halobacillus campisalis]
MSQLFYLYGMIQTRENQTNPFSELKGIDGEHRLDLMEYGELSAVFCHVDEEEFGEDVLEEKTNQMEWVKDKAFHHHEMLMKIHEQATIIPMKFCTIYKTEQNLRAMIDSHQQQMVDLLKQLDGKEEWNLKIYCDRDRLSEQVSEHNLNIKKKKEEIAQMSKGRQYLESRKIDQYIDQEVEKEQEEFSSEFHDKLADFSVNSTVKKNWNRDVTGKDEEMCWNSAYLVPLDKVENFLELVTEAEKAHGQSGWIFEATGPWPAYHFANLS